MSISADRLTRYFIFRASSWWRYACHPREHQVFGWMITSQVWGRFLYVRDGEWILLASRESIW